MFFCRAQWLRDRALDSRLREPWFESCAAVLKPWASFFTLHCPSSLSCINEYLIIYSGGYVYEQPSRINCSIWLDASQGSRDGVWVNRSVRGVKCKVLEWSWGLDTFFITIYFFCTPMPLQLFEIPKWLRYCKPLFFCYFNKQTNIWRQSNQIRQTQVARQNC